MLRNQCILAILAILLLLVVGDALGEDRADEVNPDLALGISGHAGLGIIGDSFASLGAGSLAFLRDGALFSEVGYQLSMIRLSNWESTVRFAGVSGRLFLSRSPSASANPIVGLRLHRLPYVSGFYARARWTLGLEAGVAAELLPNLWFRMSLVVLQDIPLLTGYGYLGSGAIGIEIGASNYIPLGVALP